MPQVWTLVLLCVFLINISWTYSTGTSTRENRSLSRHKRNAWQFGILVQCTYGMDCPIPIWSFNRYNNYGCHCRIGGLGDALDESDMCCYTHDRCYDRITEEYNIWSWIVYLTTYKYSCHEDGIIQCDDVTKWKRELCECDAVAARCFATNEETYNPQYLNLDKSRC